MVDTGVQSILEIAVPASCLSSLPNTLVMRAVNTSFNSYIMSNCLGLILRHYKIYQATAFLNQISAIEMEHIGQLRDDVWSARQGPQSLLTF